MVFYELYSLADYGTTEAVFLLTIFVVERLRNNRGGIFADYIS